MKIIPQRLLSLLCGIALASSSCSAEGNKAGPSDKQPVTMKIRLKIGDQILPATLVDSPTTRDFVAQLPLTLDLKDYNRTEKIADLPKKLTTKGAPSGSDPSVGDITYYAPWGNLAIFYKDFGYSSGLIILGKIDSSLEALTKIDSGKVIIEPAPQ